MANEQNLTQKGKRISTERAQELARLSAESRRQKKELVKTAREFAIAALNAETTDDKGRKYIVKDAGKSSVSCPLKPSDSAPLC